MKKILKIFLVSLISINFIFTSTLKVEASETKYTRWWVKYFFDDGTVHEGNWVINEGHAWGYSMQGNAKYVKKIRIYFDIENLEPNEKLYLDIDAEFTGIKPEMIGTTHYIALSGISMEVFPTILFEQGITSPNLHHKEQLEYENNTRYTFTSFCLEFNLVYGQNLDYIMAKINNSMKQSYTDSHLIEDTNNKVGGILETVKNIFTGITNLPSNIANSVKGFFDNVVSTVNKIQTWLANLLDGIIQGLKSLFIPSDTYFKNYFDSLYDFFSEKLGILIMPVDILISLMNNITNLQNGDGYIHVPPFEFMGVNLIPKTDYNLKVDVEKVLGNYYDMYYLLTDVIIYYMLFNMAKKKFESIVGGNQE